MSKFTGPQFPGADRAHRETKRAEAEARNSRTPKNRTKAHRRLLDSEYYPELGRRVTA